MASEAAPLRDTIESDRPLKRTGRLRDRQAAEGTPPSKGGLSTVAATDDYAGAEGKVGVLADDSAGARAGGCHVVQFAQGT